MAMLLTLRITAVDGGSWVSNEKRPGLSRNSSQEQERRNWLPEPVLLAACQLGHQQGLLVQAARAHPSVPPSSPPGHRKPHHRQVMTLDKIMIHRERRISSLWPPHFLPVWSPETHITGNSGFHTD